MTKQIYWTKAIVDAFIEEGNLNTRQETIIRSRAKGETIPKLAADLHLSIDQVNKDIADLKKIYDVVQRGCSKLPPRRKNKKDLENSLYK